MVRNFLAGESGATASEYELIATGIALAIIAAVNGLGTRLNGKFTSINSSLKQRLTARDAVRAHQCA